MGAREQPSLHSEATATTTTTVTNNDTLDVDVEYGADGSIEYKSDRQSTDVAVEDRADASTPLSAAGGGEDADKLRAQRAAEGLARSTEGVKVR